MSHYASRTRRPPRTLTDDEVARLLRITGEYRAGFRDHVILSLALGAALRESEIVALDLGDVVRVDGGVRQTIQLRVYKRAGAGAGPEAQRVSLPDSTYYKLQKFIGSHTSINLRLPLFRARGGARLSTRRVREMFRLWQVRAGFDHLYPFHALRHTALTSLRRRVGDLAIVQRAARHARLGTTAIYAAASDQEVLAAVREQVA